jgi:hypothetical protein
MFKFIKNKKIIFFTLFILILIPFSVILAMQTNWPTSPGGIRLGLGSTVTDLIAYIYQWGIALGGLVTFIALLIAGFLYLTSVGDPEKMKNALDRIKSAFLGLILLLTSWLILHTINPELTTLRPINFTIDREALQYEPLEGLTEAPKPCNYALFFSESNFQGERRLVMAGIPLIIGEDIIQEEVILTEQWFIQARSAIFCRRMVEGEIEHPDDICPRGFITGGNCSLQFFDGGFLGLGCGGAVVEVFGPKIRNFATIMGLGLITCIELVSYGE